MTLGEPYRNRFTDLLINQFWCFTLGFDEQLVKSATLLFHIYIPNYIALAIVIGVSLPQAILATIVAIMFYVLVRQYFIPTVR